MQEDGPSMANEYLLDGEERMQKSLDALRNNLATLRTGRANPGMLDRISIEYYGTPTPLKQLASYGAPDASTLRIDPYDKSVIPVIEKAILQSELGLTPNSDGKCIRLNVPAMTEDRRKGIAKQAKQIAEDSRVAIRNIRRDVVDSIKKMEKDSELSEDQSKDFQGEAQKLTDKFVKEIDETYKIKDKEIMTV
ncbi:unnamed protein product [Vitrella brassicaformis CCMP3155]|uniref:Ribosome recycling factor domain-containing protein n=2 Tax=Vitrella brassicaformis TaxID=1169539 RepID=A0A0G4H7Q4_VITBC|nr:unnamed protein product [Vitrella brassicaformis CCMP3155]|eukprot:CEM39700.1 unnamed protein product [Vitrella brassicaformis CCMP3155]